MMSRKFRIYLKFFLCTVLALVIWCSNWNVYPDPNQMINTTKNITHILILTSWRSGSSFVGQLFNQNPNVFYVMEPCWHVWTQFSQLPLKLLHLPMRDMIRSIFLCNMSTFSPQSSTKMKISNIFMWQESRALCSPPACPDSPPITGFDRLQCLRKCGKAPLEKMEDACKEYSHVVVKAVRFFNLEVLYPLLKDPSLNLKIIHLIRDPRAVFASRENFKYLTRDDIIISKAQNSKISIKVVMKEICKAQVQIYKLASQNSQLFLRGQYVLARYEDLVRSPIAYIRQLYDYVGLKMNPQFESWIYNVTHGLIPNEKLSFPYSKDSMKIAQQWRVKLNFSKVMEVQKLCQQEMDVFGYWFIESKREQKNKSLDLLLTLPKKIEWIH